MVQIDQTRFSPSKLYPQKYSWLGTDFAVGTSAPYSGRQDINTWRNKLPPGMKDPEDTQLQQTSGSQGGFAKELRDEFAKKAKSRFDTGHEFSSTKIEYIYANSDASCLRYFGSGRALTYSGLILPTDEAMTPPDSTGPPPDKIILDGSHLFKMATPTAAEAGLAQFVGELREKLPELVGYKMWKEGISPEVSAMNTLTTHLVSSPLLRTLRNWPEVY